MRGKNKNQTAKSTEGTELGRMVGFWVAYFFLVISALQVAEAASPSTRNKQLGTLVGSRSTITVSPEMRTLLPRTPEVWVHLHTTLTPEGEDVFLFAGKWQAFYRPDPHIGIIRRGKFVADLEVAKLLPRQPDDDGPGSGLYTETWPTGVAELSLGRERFLAVVLEEGGDGLGSFIVLIQYRDGQFHVVFQSQTEHGRINVVDQDSGVIELWSSKVESCNACESHYEIVTRQWDGEGFKKLSKRTTLRALSSLGVAALPITLQEAK